MLQLIQMCKLHFLTFQGWKCIIQKKALVKEKKSDMLSKKRKKSWQQQGG